MKGGDEMALVVGQPGPLRTGLEYFLMSLPQIGVVNPADDVSSALGMMQEHNPGLILLDGTRTNGEAWAALGSIRAECPQSRVLVVTDSVQQQRDAMATGADAAFIIGLPPAKLFEVVEGLLPARAAEWKGRNGQ